MVAVALFASVQVNYLTSFGLKPLRMDIAFIIIIVETIACFYLIPFIDIYMLKFILPGYVTLLFAMVWRSCARINLSGKHVDWPLVFAALGKISWRWKCLFIDLQKFLFKRVYFIRSIWFNTLLRRFCSKIRIRDIIHNVNLLFRSIRHHIERIKL